MVAQGSAGAGTVTLDDGRKIPFVRSPGPGTYVATFYGSLDATAHTDGISLLVKHERRGTTSWGANLNGFLMLEGGPSNILQGVWRQNQTRWLYLAVDHVRHFPDSLSDFRTPETAGSIIREVVLSAITGGNPHGLDLLSKCILAVENAHKKQTKRQMVADAVHAAANRLNKIPTWKEALQEFSNAGGDADEGNFTKALRDAGFAWLLRGGKR